MKQQDEELLERLEAFFKNLGLSYKNDIIGDKPALILTYDPEDDQLPGDCTITISHPGEDFTAIQMLISIFVELDEKTTADAASLLPVMNSALSIGNFGVIRDEGYLYYNYAFLTNGMSDEGVLLSAAAALSIISDTAAEGIDILLPLINGEKDVDEIRNEDIVIAQF